MRSIVITLLTLGMALPSLAQAIRIGIVNSTTGPQAPIGETINHGYILALEDLAKKGIKLELIKEDDTGKPPVALSGMEKLLTRDRVLGVVGAYTSACSSAIAKSAERAKVPLVIPVASKEEITRQGQKYVFRVSATTEDYASVLLTMALALGKPKTMAILNENTDFGTSGAKSARLIASQEGIRVVAEEAYAAGSPDYRSTLAKVKGANPDLVFMVSYVADGILLMRQARELGLRPQAFLGAGAGFSQAQFAQEREISNLVFSSTQWTPDVPWPGAKDFAQRYRAKFGKAEVPYHAANAYATLMVMGEAAAKAGGSREKLRELLASGAWDGILGKIQFKAFEGYTNQNDHPMLVEQIQNGRHETVWPAALATKKPIWPHKW